MLRSFRLFACLTLSGAIAAAQEAPVAPREQKNAEIDALIPWLLDEKQELRGIPLSQVIFRATGKRVLAIDRENEIDRRVLQQIGAALDEVIKRISAPESPVQNFARINEVSSSFENMIRELLNASPGLRCDFPKTAKERVQRSGYPDLRLVDIASNRVYSRSETLCRRQPREQFPHVLF